MRQKERTLHSLSSARSSTAASGVLRALLLLALLGVRGSRRALSECETKCHSSYSAEQREQLCRGTHKGNPVGPALCAAEAKARLSAKFDVVLQLCKGATSTQPVLCYLGLSPVDRTKVGHELCARSDSELASRCWKEMNAYGGANKVKDPAAVLAFCRQVEDDAPLQCVRAVVSSQVCAAPLAMQPCLNASLGWDGATHTPACIEALKKSIPTSRAFPPADLLDFCAHAASNGSVVCLEAALSGVPSSPPFSLADKARLCALTAGTGPVLCAQAASRENLRLRADAVVSLCSGATNEGPARCFQDARGLGSEELRTHICNGATNAGPASCFRRAQTVLKDDTRLLQLCVGALSEDPASCVYSAPHFLSAAEKINVCEAAPPGRGHEPLKCLQTVEGPAHHFKRAPAKGLGYFLSDAASKADKTSRELLVALCSFTSSSSPLTAAECLKASSFSLDHDDAVRMCTNSTSLETSRHMSLCTKLLPRDWLSSEAAALCDSVESQVDADAAVKCALDSMLKLRLSKVLAAELCRRDTKHNPVLACALTAIPYPGPSTGVDSVGGVPSALLIDVCSTASSAEPGTCIAKAFSHGSIQFQTGAIAALCKAQEPMSRLGCVASLRKQHVSLGDVLGCVGEARVISGVKVTHFMTEDFKKEATAGKLFSLRLELFDQWGQRLEFSSFEDEVALSASINENNDQGAVLWGVRSNITRRGVLELNRLMISQPGRVSFKISANRGQESIAVFSLTVKEDPASRNTGVCVALFKTLACASDMPEKDWVTYFPRIKGFVPSHHLFQVLECAETLAKWHVGVHPLPSGAVWLEYRSGVDSIWTGLNLPRLEQSFESRLEVLPGAKLKEVRRAYYKKSLQWHPDRWAGMPIYSLVVQGAFELINEAYEAISSGFKVREE